jgi:hypothetical protein
MVIRLETPALYESELPLMISPELGSRIFALLRDPPVLALRLGRKAAHADRLASAALSTA